MLTCIRCKARKRQPSVGIGNWAALNAGGYMCPRCYIGLSALRTKQHNDNNRAIARWMKVKP